MKRVDNKKNLYKSIILLVIVVIGIGYAYLTSNLSIAGNTSVTTNTWNIHFENLNVTTGSVTASTDATINAAGDAITYTINLNRPKEYYEFTVDVKNDGTLPGKVSISTISGLDATSSKVIDYTITYTNGNPVQVGDILNAGTKKTIKVRVFYKDEIDPEDFPNDDLNLILTYTLQYVQSEEDEIIMPSQIKQLIDNNESCIHKYEGQITDSVGVTKIARNVYFNRCVYKRNIIFAGYCWQMIRTTETGGIKMIYNGKPEDEKCEDNRSDVKGIIGDSVYSGGLEDLSSLYLYGDSFTYNTTTSEFTLVDTTTATWNDSTYETLLGKFTCKNIGGTCTTIYNINGYYNSTQAYTELYTIGDTKRTQIGTSTYNVNRYSPAMVGYMFNKVYRYTGISSPTSGSLMGNDVSYSNGTYTLLPADGETELGTTKDSTHHYTCNTTSSTCAKVRYYFYNNYYVELDGSENIQAIINEMLYNNDVNRYNSSIKGIIDAWYAQNLSDKTNMLEDIVYCNARNMTKQSNNGWNKDGELTKINFKNNTLNNDLSCVNVTDQFAVSNNRAKLTYPVGLVTYEELYTLTDNNSSTYYSTLINTGTNWWTFSPNDFSYYGSVRFVKDNGDVSISANVNGGYGVRPVLSLASGAVIVSGDGSTTSPWVIE